MFKFRTQGGHFDSKFQVEGVAPHQHFWRIVRPINALQLVPDSFHTAVTAEALRAKIDRKSAILHQRGHFDPKFQVQGVAADKLTVGSNAIIIISRQTSSY